MNRNNRNQNNLPNRDWHSSRSYHNGKREQEGSNQRKTSQDEKTTFRASCRQILQQNQRNQGWLAQSNTSFSNIRHDIRHDNRHKRYHPNSSINPFGWKRLKQTVDTNWNMQYSKQCAKTSREQTTGQGHKRPEQRHWLDENPKSLKNREGNNNIPKDVIIHHKGNTVDSESNSE